MKLIKLSHTSIEKFGSCPKQWEYHYITKLRSKSQGSPLYFGKAIDEALNYMLLNFKKQSREDCIKSSEQVFEQFWTEQKDSLNNLVNLTKNINIEYSKWDYDNDVLKKSDYAQIFKFNEKPFDSRNIVLDSPITATIYDLETHAFMSWLSMLRKGILFLTAYYDEFIPKYDEVIIVQQEFNISDEDNGELNGFIDLIVKLKDGKVVILDNKTSSVLYEENSVKESIQLSIYKQVIDIMIDLGTYKGPKPTHSGYAVISKKLEKTIKKTCKICGKLTDNNKLKTCDEDSQDIEIIKKTGKNKLIRCNGAFEKEVTIKVPTQFLIDEIPQSMINLVLENIDAVKKCIQNEVFPRNFSNCVNKYGKTCIYNNYCRNNDSNGLTIVEKKEVIKNG